MSSLASKFAIAVVALGLSAVGFAQAPAQGPEKTAKTGATGKTRKAPKTPVAQPPPVEPAVQVAPPQPVVPPRPEQMPPTAPQVTYQDGQLTIVAQNSTLSSILTAVRARTGAQVEMPADTNYDRVAVKLGPGNPRDVLSSLLHGSRFDYIVLGSATDPDAVSHVILTPHTGGAATAVAGQPAVGVSGGQPVQRPGPPLAGGVSRPEMNADEDDPVEPPPPPEPAPAAISPQMQMQMQPQIYPPGTPAPGMQGTPDQTQSAVPGQPNTPVKTPEQLLQELQRIQQQQRQQPQQLPRGQPPQQ